MLYVPDITMHTAHYIQSSIKIEIRFDLYAMRSMATPPSNVIVSDYQHLHTTITTHQLATIDWSTQSYPCHTIPDLG